MQCREELSQVRHPPKALAPQCPSLCLQGQRDLGTGAAGRSKGPTVILAVSLGVLAAVGVPEGAHRMTESAGKTSEIIASNL